VSPFLEELPPLDAHAHLAPDVTEAQLRRLNGAVVFGMTRSLAEADYVADRQDQTVAWGLGTHPTSYRDLASFDASQFGRLVDRFAVIGEVGLDFRGGRRQREVFDYVLQATAGRPVLVSIHSTGMVAEVLDALDAYRQKAPILHWFMGGQSDIDRAVELGCYFSVNAAMPDEQIAVIPRDRMIPETDFPTADKAGARRPGDTISIEERLGRRWAETPTEVRHSLYVTLRQISLASGAIEAMPSDVVGHLLAA
jgi:TatD DNase family protein